MLGMVVDIPSGKQVHLCIITTNDINTNTNIRGYLLYNGSYYSKYEDVCNSNRVALDSLQHHRVVYPGMVGHRLHHQQGHVHRL